MTSTCNSSVDTVSVLNEYVLPMMIRKVLPRRSGKCKDVTRTFIVDCNLSSTEFDACGQRNGLHDVVFKYGRCAKPSVDCLEP